MRIEEMQQVCTDGIRTLDKASQFYATFNPERVRKLFAVVEAAKYACLDELEGTSGRILYDPFQEIKLALQDLERE